MALARSKGFSAGRISPLTLQGIGCEAQLERLSNRAMEIHKCGEVNGLQGYLAG